MSTPRRRRDAGCQQHPWSPAPPRGENWPLCPKAHHCAVLGRKRRGVSVPCGVQPGVTKRQEPEGLLCPLPTLWRCRGSVPSSPGALARTEHPLPSPRSCWPCAGSALASISPPKLKNDPKMTG